VPTINELEELIEHRPQQSADAWAGLIASGLDLPTLDGIRPFVPPFLTFERHWAMLIHDGLEVTDQFLAAVRGQGVRPAWDEPVPLGDKFFTDDFQARARAFRCRIYQGPHPFTFRGSGVLVGPTSVLTAWHVITCEPLTDKKPAPHVEVEFADGRRVEAEVPVRLHSECGSRELQNLLPLTDAEIQDLADVALLRLREPVGLGLSFPALAEPTSSWPGSRPLGIVQYPEGNDLGMSYGRTLKLRKLTGRWGHDVAAAAGSSGGGCFDASHRLLGIHQGAAPNGLGRLVPVGAFPSKIREGIAADEVPPVLWSVDGTLNSPLVVGRSGFFRAYHACMRGNGRARGIWVRRVNPRDTSGLGFTFRLLAALAARSPTVRVARISFNSVLDDHVAEIARRVREAGIEIDVPEPEGGVAPGQTQPEAVMADRSRPLAERLSARAVQLGLTLWLAFEHPGVIFGDEPRWAVVAFAEHALRLEGLRVLLVGYEAVQMGGERYLQPEDAVDDRGPGRIIEFLGGFTRQDVLQTLDQVVSDLGLGLTAADVEVLADKALSALPLERGVHPPWTGRIVDEILRPELAAALAAVVPTLEPVAEGPREAHP
jgi:hypothetical protein